MLISSMFEILSGAVIPLISLLIDPEILNNISQVNQIEQILKINLDAISKGYVNYIYSYNIVNYYFQSACFKRQFVYV